jgi:hypothetical protein
MTLREATAMRIIYCSTFLVRSDTTLQKNRNMYKQSFKIPIVENYMKVQAIEKEAKEGQTYSSLVFCLPHIFEEREVNCLSSLLPSLPGDFLLYKTDDRTRKWMDG